MSSDSLLHIIKLLQYITRGELASLAHSSYPCINTTSMDCADLGSIITRCCGTVAGSRARAHMYILADHVTQLAKKLVTHLAALLSRTPGTRRLEQNRLPRRSTHGKFRIPKRCFLSPPGRHWVSTLGYSILYTPYG